MRVLSVTSLGFLLSMGLALSGCGKRSGIRAWQGQQNLQNVLSNAPAASYNSDRTGQTPRSNTDFTWLPNPSSSVQTPCVTCGTTQCPCPSGQTTGGSTGGDEDSAGLILAKLDDEAKRLQGIQACNEPLRVDNDYDFDGVTDKCEEARGMNPMCHNAAAVSGVILDTKVMKDIIRDDGGHPFWKSLTFPSQNEWVDTLIERLSKEHGPDSQNVTKTIYQAHWDATGTRRQKKKKRFSHLNNPFRMSVDTGYDLLDVLQAYRVFPDAQSFDASIAEDLTWGGQVALVHGGRKYPLVTDPVETGQGRITGLADSADNLAGRGGYLVLAEFFLSKPGTYRFFTGKLLANGYVQETVGKGNYFQVTDGKDTVLTSSVKLAYKGRRSKDPSDRQNVGNVVVGLQPKHITVTSIIRKMQKGGSYINDTLFVQYTNTVGDKDQLEVTDSSKANKEVYDIASFISQESIQVSNGINETAGSTILATAMAEYRAELAAYLATTGGGGSQFADSSALIDDVFFKNCGRTSEEAITALNRAKDLLVSEDELEALKQEIQALEGKDSNVKSNAQALKSHPSSHSLTGTSLANAQAHIDLTEKKEALEKRISQLESEQKEAKESTKVVPSIRLRKRVVL